MKWEHNFNTLVGSSS